MELKYFILRRSLVIIPTLMGLTVITFILLWGLGPELIYRGINSSPKVNIPLSQQALILSQNGFSAAVVNGKLVFTNPIGMYFNFVSDLFRGNWGYIIGQPLTAPTLQAIEFYFPNTIQLAVGATVMALLIAMPLGTYIGARPNSASDQVGRIFSLSGYALPAFWLGLVLIVLFGNNGTAGFGNGTSGNTPVGIIPYLNIFPYFGNGTEFLSTTAPKGFFSSTFGQTLPTHIFLIDSLIAGKLNYFVIALAHMVLPVATVTYGVLAGILRFIRAGMVDASGQEFVKTARAKGVPEGQVIKKHIRKNALLPTVTVLGLLISGLLGGVVTVEIVFNYKGIGWLAVQAALNYQAWGILAITFLFGIILMVTNLIVDVVYAFMDPRIRY